MEKEKLKAEISDLEMQIKPKRDRLREIYFEEEKETEERIQKAMKGQGDFNLEELRFASKDRCICSAGFAYPTGIGIHGSWYCSTILMGKAIHGSSHSDALPFSFYNIKSEDQPSANGVTTRPI